VIGNAPKSWTCLGAVAVILKHMLNYSDSLDRAFQALADRTRRMMVARLTRGSATVSELKAPLVMSLPAVMQHLAVLETSGLVVSEKAGRVRTCRLNPSALAEAERWIAERRIEWERRLDRLDEYLQSLKKGEADGQDR
jgi:DNA-binding transcriptional ArsR family regulator